MSLTIFYAVLVLLLAGWAAACADCPGCGGCTEPAAGTPNSSLCTPDATSGYRFCVWPAISGAGCLPGGDCQRFANQKYCLRWVSDGLWQTSRFTVDCTTTYGVMVDIQWQLTIGAAGAVTLQAIAYVTGTGTVAATLVTYTGFVNLTRCDQPFSVAYSSDGGQCQNWPRCVIVSPLCCGDCGFDAYGCTTSDCTPCRSLCTGLFTGVDPPRATVHGIAGVNAFCSGCATQFTGADIHLVWLGGCSSGFDFCNDHYQAFSVVAWCPETPDTGWTVDFGITQTTGRTGVTLTGTRTGILAVWELLPSGRPNCGSTAVVTLTLTQQFGCNFGTVGVSTITVTWD